MSLFRTLTLWARGRVAPARLRVLDGPHRGRVYPLTRRRTTLGKGGDIPLAETSPGVTVEYLPAPGRFRLRAASAAGVLVNDSPVQGEAWLSPGDRLQIGSHTLRFEARAPVPPLAQPPSAPAATPLSEGLAQEPPRFVGRELSVPAPPSAPAPAPEYLPGGGAVGTRLICLSGPYRGQSFLLSHAPAMVGRASAATISLPADLSLSRRHAEITYVSGRHLLSDAGSVNGTRLNDAPLTETLPLVPGDVIALGDTLLRYE